MSSVKGTWQRESDEEAYEKGHDSTFSDPVNRERCGHADKYEAIFRPRCGCRACWTLYREEHPREVS